MQRVLSAQVTVADAVVGAVGRGLLVFAGFGHDDDARTVTWMAQRLAGLRIFVDDAGKMNRDVRAIDGAILAVPQFTLYGDCRHGRRPDFTAAAEPVRAATLFDEFCRALRQQQVPVATGAFREHMHVALVNDGPVTLWLEHPQPDADRSHAQTSTNPNAEVTT